MFLMFCICLTPVCLDGEPSRSRNASGGDQYLHNILIQIFVCSYLVLHSNNLFTQ